MDIIKKQRIKFTLVTTLISAIFLLVLLGSFFGLSCVSNETVLKRSLKDAAKDPDTYSEITPSKLKIMFIRVNVQGDINYEGEFDFYGELKKDVIRAALKKRDGKFKVGDSYFAAQSYIGEDGASVIAILDRTAYHEQIVTSALQVVLLYCCAVALVALLAFLSSARLLHPVSEAFTKQRDLIANASHELKTPLTIISTNLSVIKSEPNSTVADNEHWIESIDAQIYRMQELIRNMLELSRLEQSAPRFEDVNISLLAEGACLTFEVLCFEKNVHMLTEIQPDIFVEGDKASLERLCTILLDNAIKYCNDGGKVGFKLEREPKRVRLTVLNTGEVISKEDAEHVFDRFYRTDGARKNEDNTSFGLGLAIAAATVNAHGGTISCKGVEDKGTVFTVFLPLPKRTRHNKKSAH